jgi:hypothetical protein
LTVSNNASPIFSANTTNQAFLGDGMLVTNATYLFTLQVTNLSSPTNNLYGVYTGLLSTGSFGAYVSALHYQNNVGLAIASLDGNMASLSGTNRVQVTITTSALISVSITFTRIN